MITVGRFDNRFDVLCDSIMIAGGVPFNGVGLKLRLR